MRQHEPASSSPATRRIVVALAGAAQARGSAKGPLPVEGSEAPPPEVHRRLVEPPRARRGEPPLRLLLRAALLHLRREARGVHADPVELLGGGEDGEEGGHGRGAAGRRGGAGGGVEGERLDHAHEGRGTLRRAGRGGGGVW